MVPPGPDQRRRDSAGRLRRRPKASVRLDRLATSGAGAKPGVDLRLRSGSARPWCALEFSVGAGETGCVAPARVARPIETECRPTVRRGSFADDAMPLLRGELDRHTPSLLIEIGTGSGIDVVAGPIRRSFDDGRLFRCGPIPVQSRKCRLDTAKRLVTHDGVGDATGRNRGAAPRDNFSRWPPKAAIRARRDDRQRECRLSSRRSPDVRSPRCPGMR